MAVVVPKVVETIVEMIPMIRVLVKASKTRVFWKRAKYHFKVKPVQTALIREELKEYRARIIRGRYKKASTAKE
jgi:hypothetical protein